MKTTLSRWKSSFPHGRVYNAICVRVDPSNLLHAHDFAEVFWIRHGTGVHFINGLEKEMQKGDLSMIRPYRDAHYFRSSTPDFTIVNVAFSAALLTDIRRRYFNSPSFWGGAGACPEICHMTEPEQQWLNAAADGLFDAPQERLLLDRFLLNLICSVGSGQPDLFRACPDWLKKACEAIRLPEQFGGGIKTLFRLARRSPEHVARTLKKHTGRTPSELVNSVRLEYAAAQLLTTTREIQEIALDCGYDSLSYFYMLFKRKYGMSPRHYRLAFFKPTQIMFPGSNQESLGNAPVARRK